MTLILISAMTRARVIGKDRALPWNIPDEYDHFLASVRGHPVIMGRASFEIFGPDLPDSPMIVVSRSLAAAQGATVRHDIESAIECARGHGDRVFSAGGATIYRQTLPLANELHLSYVKQDYEGDTFFPEFDEKAWVVRSREDHPLWELRIYERAT